MDKMIWSFSGNEATMEDVKACVGSGWGGIIDALVPKLFAAGWDGGLLQVKEKFGGLRFYVASGNDEIFDAIKEAEGKSIVTCEITGKPGKLRTDLGWVTTLCDEEYNKVKDRSYG